MTRSFIPFDRPTITEDDIAEVVDSLRSGWITTGPKVKQFEADFAAYTGAKHALALSSGTAAMHTALLGKGIGPGDEVITPAYTFCATAHVIEHTGATVIPADVDPHTYNISGQTAAAVITPRTKAIIPVHLGGLPCPMDELTALAQQHNLFLLEDAAHAAGAGYHGQKIGVIGDATAFSFYATKNLTTAEGGILTTDDDDLARQVRIFTLHGMSRDAWDRYTEKGSWAYQVVEAGFKYNLPDVLAAMGLGQLKHLDERIAVRQELTHRYNAAFAAAPQLITPAAAPAGVDHSHHLYILRLQLDQLTITRADFIAALKERGIGASVHFIPLYRLDYYHRKYNWQPEDFPVCESIFRSCLSLPLYPTLSPADQDYIIETVLDLVKHHRV